MTMSKPQETNDTPELQDAELHDVLSSQPEDSLDESKIELDVDVSIDALGAGDQLESLKMQLRDAEDRVLRRQAELENFRRRARRESEEQRKFANQPLLMSLFPVMDNIDRAIAAASQAADASGLLEGFRMVAQQLVDTLQEHNCHQIDALGQLFDPALHEAISQQPSDEYPSGTVTKVAQVGYQLHDRVIRPAQVIVSTGPAEK
jgi:molecular chaperone GrpE